MPFETISGKTNFVIKMSRGGRINLIYCLLRYATLPHHLAIYIYIYIVTTDSEEINYACIQSTMSLWTLPLRIEKYRKGKLLQLVKMHNITLSYKKQCYQFFDFSWQNFVHKNSLSKLFYNWTNIISTIVFSVKIIGEIKMET